MSSKSKVEDCRLLSGGEKDKTVPGPCYYHPETASAANCFQCGMPACANCLQQITGRTICSGCADSFKAKLAQQAAPSPFASGGQAPSAYGSAAARVAADPSDRKELLIGIVLALVIGVIGAVIIEKILFYGHFGLSLLYVGMGYGIGWGIHRATGRGGAGLALLAVGIMVTCLGVSHLVYAQDVLNEVRAAGNADPGATVLDAFPIAMGSLGFMHWVCIVFGLMACYRGVEAQQG